MVNEWQAVWQAVIDFVNGPSEAGDPEPMREDSPVAKTLAALAPSRFRTAYALAFTAAIWHPENKNRGHRTWGLCCMFGDECVDAQKAERRGRCPLWQRLGECCLPDSRYTLSCYAADLESYTHQRLPTLFEHADAERRGLRVISKGLAFGLFRSFDDHLAFSSGKSLRQWGDGPACRDDWERTDTLPIKGATIPEGLPSPLPASYFSDKLFWVLMDLYRQEYERIGE